MNLTYIKKLQHRRRLATFLSGLLGGAAGFLICIQAFRTTDALFSGTSLLLPLLVFILALYLSQFLHTVLHEGGHLVFGLITGYSFLSFRVSKVMFVKTDSGIKVKKYSIPGTAGQCLMLPPDMKDGKIPYVLYNLGGIISSAVFSSAALAIYCCISKDGVIATVLLTFAVMGFVSVLNNAIPFLSPIGSNDGANIIAISKSSEAMRAFWIELKMVAMLVDGNGMNDLPEEWFTGWSDEAMNNKMSASTCALLCDRLMAEHRFAQADEFITKILSGPSALTMRNIALLINEKMYIEAITNARASVIDSMKPDELKGVFKQLRNDCSVLRARYAYMLLCKNNETEAAQIKAAFNKVVEKYPYSGIVRTEKELMDIVDSIKNGVSPN